MLAEIVVKKHYLFAAEAADWEEAIRMSCGPLEADGTVEDSYKEEIIACVKKYGPYIVIMPEVAMPHCQECARGVHKTAVSFMKLDKPVDFQDEGKTVPARLFFTLASCDSERHLQNMMKLSELLMKEEAVKELMKAETPDDLLRIQKEYFDQ